MTETSESDTLPTAKNNPMINAHMDQLTAWREQHNATLPICTPMSNGAHLITVPSVDIGPGWSERVVDVLFVAPVGYPGAAPCCFWIGSPLLTLADGNIPHYTNRTNIIPGDLLSDRKTTWFGWKTQMHDPNKNTLLTYFNVIMRRMRPAR